MLVDDAVMTNAMNRKESSAAAVDAFEGVAADLAGAGVALGQTFGSRQGPKAMPVTVFG